MNIGFFTDTYFPQVNGVTFTLKAWKERLEKRGHQVYIYYPAGEYKPGERETPFKSIEFKAYRGYRIAMPLRIAKHTGHLDIIHEHGLYGMAISGWLAAKLNGKPKMLTFHTPGDEYVSYLTGNRPLGRILAGTYLLWERILLNSFDHVTTASPVVKERLAANGIKDAEVLSNGIELELFHRTDTKEFRRRHDIKSKRTIGFCGRLGYEKHLEDLINAADSFDGTVLIAGSGPAEEHYRKLAEGKGNVRFLGFISHDTLREFYSALDVFIFPSFAETQGLVALEAMACGTPVVGVPVLALKTTIRDGDTGYHYTPGNTEELLKRIDDCYRNTDKLRKNALKEAEANSMEKTVNRLEEIYDGLNKNRR